MILLNCNNRERIRKKITSLLQIKLLLTERLWIPLIMTRTMMVLSSNLQHTHPIAMAPLITHVQKKTFDLTDKEHCLLVKCFNCDKFFTMRARPRKVTFCYNGTEYLTEALVLTVSNKHCDILYKIFNSLLCDYLKGFSHLILFSMHRDIGAEHNISQADKHN